ncbi:uncharacterized protein BDZ99DRAFT_515335 [Mytilinidion resinicola]|uniref:F-box domain-containing protein n=1 Tax=Mytilinidion resinicola TaxID=574789 RepID=A0A6A6Z2T8_9PEZI|nr:uncharacterized protein BDZ99DRAFT_515335 [Mytilinidion resinicola]KAF2814547.1 hypothetical protein BDZ99DRAFT_515335 [Mytilinidion resinicola]
MALQSKALEDAPSPNASPDTLLDGSPDYFGPSGFLAYPTEIVEIIAEALPRNSFLALRQTCKEIQEKADYHFKNRHLLAKRVALVDGACLNTLVELASQPKFASRVRHVHIEIEDSLILLASDTASRQTRKVTDWTNPN